MLTYLIILFIFIYNLYAQPHNYTLHLLTLLLFIIGSCLITTNEQFTLSSDFDPSYARVHEQRRLINKIKEYRNQNKDVYLIRNRHTTLVNPEYLAKPQLPYTDNTVVETVTVRNPVALMHQNQYAKYNEINKLYDIIRPRR